MNERVTVQTSSIPAKPEPGQSTEVTPEKDRGIKSIGRFLAAAREERNFGQTELSRELNLAPSILDALEKGDRSRLPEMTYVRGYLRAYGRLLGIEDEINKRVTDELPNEWPDSDTSTLSRLTVSTGEEFGGDDRRGTRWWLLLLIPILLLGLLYWLYTSYNDEVSAWLGDTTRAGSSTTILSDGNGSDVIEVVEAVAKDSVERVEEAVVDPIQEAAASIIGASEDAEATDNSSAVDDSAAEAETVVIQETPTVIDDRTEAVASITEVSVPAPIEPEVTETETSDTTSDTEADATQATVGTASRFGDNALVIEAGKDSWIEVASAQDDRLVHRLVRRGERLELDGSPPFRLLIGDSGGVNVRYRGQALDFQRYARGNVARFVIRNDDGGFVLDAASSP
ncbi:DUF4115 domain-containing protein [Gammaproteobacteria bacterium]|nr:DUF4115 domain-containing protein [Gammaproteobacteria bacterium]